MNIIFRVNGKPATAGSKRGFPVRRKDGSVGVAMAPDNVRARPWMAAVADEASKHATEVSYQPISLLLTFYFCRPKSHFKTRKGVRTLKESAPAFKTGKPDCTKLARAVEDALTGIVWKDDSQIVGHHVYKTWGEQEGVFVHVMELEEQEQGKTNSDLLSRNTKGTE